MYNLQGRDNPSWEVTLANIPTGLASTDGIHGGGAGGERGRFAILYFAKDSFLLSPILLETNYFFI